MIVPGNEKLFKKWATLNGLEQNKDKIDYISQLHKNEQGHITNAEKAINIIQQLQLEVLKLQAENRVCINNTLSAVSALLTHHHGLFKDDPIIKTVMTLPHESVKGI